MSERWLEIPYAHDTRRTFWLRGRLQIHCISGEYRIVDGPTNEQISIAYTLNSAMVRAAEFVSAGRAKFEPETETHVVKVQL